MNQRIKNRPIGITMGDAAGIGPEILIRMHSEGLKEYSVVYGDARILESISKIMDSKIKILSFQDVSETKFIPGTLNVIKCGLALPKNIIPGKINALAGRASFDYVKKAIADALSGKIRAIVTAPLNKESMHKAGIPYPGHTEIFAKYTGTHEYAMLLSNEALRVLLVTIHIPLAQVPRKISLQRELLAIKLANKACQQIGIQEPKIAVAALNPHAGEGGKFGSEEKDIIAPAIYIARNDGIKVSGPWPADTIFMKARLGEFDIVVAQYHDQGLIPIKYMGLENGVNSTIGLPFVRTSTDHGTAFDIAWKGKASAESLNAAFKMALFMTSNFPIK